MREFFKVTQNTIGLGITYKILYSDRGRRVSSVVWNKRMIYRHAQVVLGMINEAQPSLLVNEIPENTQHPHQPWAADTLRLLFISIHLIHRVLEKHPSLWQAVSEEDKWILLELNSWKDCREMEMKRTHASKLMGRQRFVVKPCEAFFSLAASCIVQGNEPAGHTKHWLQM